MQIKFSLHIWQEGKMFVAYTPQLDISSCGETLDEAKNNLLEAVNIFLKETTKMGTLKDILEEAGFTKENYKTWDGPELVAMEKMQTAI